MKHLPDGRGGSHRSALSENCQCRIPLQYHDPAMSHRPRNKFGFARRRRCDRLCSPASHARMLHMAMTDVDVGTGHARPAQRSPDTKAAVEYLIAFGATAITIVEIDGVCAFHTGHKIDPRAVSVQWLPETHARAVVRQARRDAGRNPDAATAARALAQAAADHRQTLTPDDV